MSVYEFEFVVRKDGNVVLPQIKYKLEDGDMDKHYKKLCLKVIQTLFDKMTERVNGMS